MKGFVNIHGQPITGEVERALIERQVAEKRRQGALGHHLRKPAVKNGYAFPPGSGPRGETCATCEHKHSMTSPGGSKHFIKCEAARARWTHGEGSDILARSPACRAWQSKPDNRPGAAISDEAGTAS